MHWEGISSSRFTSAGRNGFKFTGGGTIAVAGGEQLWLYINKILVIEIKQNPDHYNLTCMKVDLTNAATPGRSGQWNL